ncbi:hypothetical protein CR513_05304, partial [Mucuna pruriens]
MKHKYEVCHIFVDFFYLVKNQFNKSIKRLWLDNGTEFVNLEFSKFLKDNGVIHELTALLFQMYVPNVYWGEAILTVTYLINRLPTRVLNSISQIKHMLSFFPFSFLMLSLPSCVFGCVAFVHSHNPHRGKLDPKGVKCVFTGYPSNKKDFNCYHPSSHRFFVSIDVTFHETQLFFVCPPLQGESYLEVKPVIESLHFPTHDVQVQVQEVTKPTLVPKQVQMSKLDVSIPNNSIEEQVQLSESEVSIPNNSIEDVTDDNYIQKLGKKFDRVNKGLDYVQKDTQSVIAKMEALSREKEEKPKVASLHDSEGSFGDNLSKSSGRSSQFSHGKRCEKHGRRGKVVRLVRLEFGEYALVWWTQDIRSRVIEPCESWRDLKCQMRKRFVLPSYARDLHNKLQRLYQGSKSVEEYYKEMEID